MARAIGERATALGRRFGALVEIDSGHHRGGVAPGDPELIAIARILDASTALDLAGVLTHAGHAYHARGEELVAIAEQERTAIVGAADRVREAGLPCPVVSAGSTPTALSARSLEGVTEMRPGVYVFQDLDQHGRGCCELEDLAVSVLATVIGSHPDRGTVLVDAGALALSKDTMAEEHLPGVGHGWVCDAETRERLGDLRVTALEQEHGFVGGSDLPRLVDRLRPGARVRILPGHVCLTAGAHDRFHVVDGETESPLEVIAEWERARGW